MAKVKITIAIILLLSSFSFGFYMIWASGESYENKGKKALINGRDSCMIVSEEKEFFMRNHPRQITVMYKDGYGKYVNQRFDSDLITIIK